MAIACVFAETGLYRRRPLKYYFFYVGKTDNNWYIFEREKKVETNMGLA